MRAKEPVNYQDLIGLPEQVVGEIVSGEMVASPRPALEHARVTLALAMELGPPFQRGRGGPGGWWLLVEPELHLGDDVLVPDLAGWRVDRMPKPPSGPFATLAPDWLCEVLSPATARLDRMRKMPIYAREQVRHAWLLDPSEHKLEAFTRRRGGGAWQQLGAWAGTERARIDPFEALELDLSGLWK